MKTAEKQTITNPVTKTQKIPLHINKFPAQDRFGDDLYEQAMEFVGSRFSRLPPKGSTVSFRDELHADGVFSLDTIIDAVLFAFNGLTVGEAYNVVKNAINERKIRTLSGKKVFCPNESPIYQDDTGLWIENLWRRPSVIPKAGTVRPFFDFCCYLFPNPAERAYVLGMLKYKVQHPVSEPKQAHSLYLFSTGQGIGKGLFKNMLSAVIGEDNVAQLISQSELKSQNAPQYMRKAIMFVEEANVFASSRTYDLLKAYITESKTGTNYKFQDSGQEEIPAMIIFLSNRPPEFLEEGDRRFFVPELAKITDREKTKKMTSDFANWIAQADNIAAVSHWFHTSALEASRMQDWEIQGLNLDRDDLIDYDPQGPALRTEAYRQVIENNNMPDVAILLSKAIYLNVGVEKLVYRPQYVAEKIKEEKLSIRNVQQVMQQLGYYRRRVRIRPIDEFLYIQNGWEVMKEDNKPYLVHETKKWKREIVQCIKTMNLRG